MQMKILGAWFLATYVLTYISFNIILSQFVSVTEAWHQRLVDSNISFALALFFLYLLTLGHGLLGATHQARTRIMFNIYRTLILPLMIAVAILIFLPVSLVPVAPVSTSQYATLVFWLLVSGDVTGKVGPYIATREWFIEKVLVGKGSGIYRGMGGRLGLVAFNAGVVAILVAGLLFR